MSINALEVLRLRRKGLSSEDIALVTGTSVSFVQDTVLSQAFAKVQRVKGYADTYCRWESIQELESVGLDALLDAVKGDSLSFRERIVIAELLDGTPGSAFREYSGR